MNIRTSLFFACRLGGAVLGFHLPAVAGEPEGLWPAPSPHGMRGLAHPGQIELWRHDTTLLESRAGKGKHSPFFKSDVTPMMDEKSIERVLQSAKEWEEKLTKRAGGKMELLDEKDDKGNRAKAAGTKEAGAASSSVSQLYLQMHLHLKAGNQLEAAGDWHGALAKYKEAQEMLEKVRELDSQWNPEIVEYRRSKLTEDLKRIAKRLEAQPSAVVSEAEGKAGEEGRAEPEEGAGKSESEVAANGPLLQPGDRFPEGMDEKKPATPEQRRKQEKAAKQAKREHLAKHEKHKNREVGEVKEGKSRAKNSEEGKHNEMELLRRRLLEMEESLQKTRRREAALRVLVKDLLEEADPVRRRDGAPQPSGAPHERWPSPSRLPLPSPPPVWDPKPH